MRYRGWERYLNLYIEQSLSAVFYAVLLNVLHGIKPQVGESYILHYSFESHKFLNGKMHFWT